MKLLLCLLTILTVMTLSGSEIKVYAESYQDDRDAVRQFVRDNVQQLLMQETDLQDFEATFYRCYDMIREASNYLEDDPDSRKAILEEEMLRNAALYAYLSECMASQIESLDALQKYLAGHLLRLCEEGLFEEYQGPYICLQGNSEVETFNQERFTVLDTDLSFSRESAELMKEIGNQQPDIVCLQGVVDERVLYFLYEKLKDDYTHFYVEVVEGRLGMPFGAFVATKGPLVRPEFGAFMSDKLEMNEAFFCLAATHNHTAVRAGTKYGGEIDRIPMADGDCFVTKIELVYKPRIPRDQLSCRSHESKGLDDGYNNGRDRSDRSDCDASSSRSQDRTRDSDREDRAREENHIRGSVDANTKDGISGGLKYSHESRDDEGNKTTMSIDAHGGVDSHGNAHGGVIIGLEKVY